MIKLFMSGMFSVLLRKTIKCTCPKNINIKFKMNIITLLCLTYEEGL